MEPLPRVFDMLQYFETIWEKQLGKEWSHAIARTARGDDSNDAHLFSLLSRLLSVNKFKSSLKFLIKQMINASSCTAELWMHSGDVLAGLQSAQQLEE